MLALWWGFSGKHGWCVDNERPRSWTHTSLSCSFGRKEGGLPLAEGKIRPSPAPQGLAAELRGVEPRPFGTPGALAPSQSTGPFPELSVP